VQSRVTNQARELDTIHLTGVIVRLRINGVVVFTRSRIEAEVVLDNISSTTIRNRLKELVEAGVLSVDTTGDAHRFTLAVPGSSSFVPLKTWRSETESFMPIAWDGMNTREPAHAANGFRPDTKRWEVMIDAEQWPTYGQPSTICDNTDSQAQYKRTSTGGTNLETTTQSATVGSYESSSAYDRSGGNILPAGSTTNQYAVYGTIARKATAGLGGSAIIAGGVFGQQSVAHAIVGTSRMSRTFQRQ